ncbi:MAG: group II intron reverse transcriptase/maturase, partial [Chlorobaculum sp.]|nr:group II intron reverse transcriptase/maturase [Chlorobaculum sp.]
MERRAERKGKPEIKLLRTARHQKPEASGRAARGQGEAEAGGRGDEAELAQQEREGLGRTDLLEQAFARANMVKAWKRVKANGGSAGVDGLTIEATLEKLRTDWPRIKEELLKGQYRPEPVRRVQIPKAGGGQRELGIPTVTDRLIQQALLQVLQPKIDPTLSDSSYGFRPGRNAQGAVLQAQRYVQEGYEVVVDVDLEKFFDRVNHDILMERLSRRISDKRVLRLIRRYLEVGIMDGGVVMERHGLNFVRYADDCNVYVGSQKAGERVLQGMRKLYERLHLKVNESKTSVGRVYGRKFLGYSLWKTGGKVKLNVSKQALKTFKARIRQKTRRSTGRSMEQVIEVLRSYVTGWK